MTDRFNKALKISVGLHVVVVILFLVFPLLRSWFKREKPKEVITFVELVQPAPPAPAPQPRVQEPEPPKPVPPKPEPPKPEPPKPEPPKPEPKPEPPKPVAQRVVPQTNRVVRRDQTPPTPDRPRLTEQQLRDQLLSSLPTTQTPTAPASSPNELSAYYGQVQRILYQAWEQPPGVA